MTTTTTTITERDITTLATKLTGFVETLTPGERAAFEVFETEMTATLTTTTTTDVQAYTMTTREGTWKTLLTTVTGTTTTTTV